MEIEKVLHATTEEVLTILPHLSYEELVKLDQQVQDLDKKLDINLVSDDWNTIVFQVRRELIRKFPL